jgi:hypothetical protein
MFTPKANSKQKRMKKTQERETGNAATVQLAPTSKSTREARKLTRSTSCSPPTRLQLAVASWDSPVTGKPIFSPQNPNFDFPKLKFDHKVCLNISKHEKTLKIM